MWTKGEEDRRKGRKGKEDGGNPNNGHTRKFVMIEEVVGLTPHSIALQYVIISTVRSKQSTETQIKGSSRYGFGRTASRLGSSHLLSAKT